MINCFLHGLICPDTLVGDYNKVYIFICNKFPIQRVILPHSGGHNSLLKFTIKCEDVITDHGKWARWQTTEDCYPKYHHMAIRLNLQ